MAGALALALGLALAADGTLEAGVRVEVRGRALELRGAGWTPVTEASALPRLEARLVDAPYRLACAYEPALVAADLPGRVDVLHVARLELGARAAPGLALGALVSGARGTSSLVREARLAGEAGGVVASTASLDRSEVRAAVDGRAAVRRGSTATALVAVERGGGEGAAAEALLPVRRAWLLSAAWSERAGLGDTLELALDASDTRIRGARADLATLTAAWRRRLAPGLEGRAAALLGGGRAQPPGAASQASLVVGGEAGLVRQRPGRAAADRLALRATPQVDRVTGQLVEDLELELRSEGDVAPRWWLGAGLAWVRHLRSGPDVMTGRAEVRLERRLAPRLAVGGGLYGVWQASAAPDLPSFFEGGAFASLAWRSGRLEAADAARPAALVTAPR